MSKHTLGDIPVGHCTTVTAIGSLGALKRRLIDMGITPGVKVTVKRMAPLGDPIEIALRGYVLSLRRADAKLISCTPPERKRA